MRQPENAVLSSSQESPVQPPHLRHRISIRNGRSVSEQAAQRISAEADYVGVAVGATSAAGLGLRPSPSSFARVDRLSE
jgi:hypothetical protein